jgi:hypothetical protein
MLKEVSEEEGKSVRNLCGIEKKKADFGKQKHLNFYF